MVSGVCLTVKTPHDEFRARFERDALPLIGRVLRVARHFVRHERDAEDLVQETYRRAFERFDQFREGTNLLAWLNRILYTLFITHYRKESVRRTIPLAEDDLAVAELPAFAPESGNFVQWLLSSQSREQLDQSMFSALRDLPAPMSEVLVLCVIGELTYREASDALGVPVGTVMSRLSRAKVMMRAALARVITQSGPLGNPYMEKRP